jgi:16S rRNA (guanine966-N2)-methyltransferase
MRVIAGNVRGFRLKGPASFSTRPMADKIKGALFSMLGSLGVEIDRVLDLYAGTGSIGIEALSRGASWADFVEQNSAACAVIRANLEHTRFQNVSRVHQTAVATYLSRRDTPYDFVILDPPYADPAIVETLAKVESSALVQSGTIVVIGHSPRVELPEAVGRMVRLRERCHGDSCFSIYEVDPPEGEAADVTGGEDAAEGIA